MLVDPESNRVSMEGRFALIPSIRDGFFDVFFLLRLCLALIFCHSERKGPPVGIQGQQSHVPDEGHVLKKGTETKQTTYHQRRLKKSTSHTMVRLQLRASCFLAFSRRERRAMISSVFHFPLQLP